jgi:hypothetical protein
MALGKARLQQVAEKLHFALDFWVAQRFTAAIIALF